MAGQVSILDDNFVVDDSNGISRFTAVVQGGNDGSCQNPSGAGAGQFIGIAQEDKDDKKTANIRMIGNSYAKAVGAISAGATLMIGDSSGRVDDIANSTSSTPPPNIGFALTSASNQDDWILVAVGHGR